jgi:hypothetical protein
MAVGVFMEFPGVTREQYEQLVQDLALRAVVNEIGPPLRWLLLSIGP